MSTLYIVEGQGTGKQATGEQQAMLMPYITIQRVTFTGAAGYSAALNANTSLVRIWTDAQAAVKASATSSAAVASNDMPLAALTPEYFAVPTGGGIYFSVISNT